MDPSDKSAASLVHLLKRLGLIPASINLDTVGLTEGNPISALAKQGYIDERQTIEAVAKELRVEYVDVEDEVVRSTLATASFVDRIDGEMCWKRQVAPLWQNAQSITLAMSNPLDVGTQQFLSAVLNKPITPAIAEESKILRLLGEHFPPPQAEVDKMLEVGEQSVEILTTRNLEAADKAVDLGPIVNLCNRIIAGAVERDASDIHIESQQYTLDVRYRVDGKMRHVLEIPKGIQLQVLSRLKLLAGMDIAERRRPQDGRIRIRVRGENLDLRVSSIPVLSGENLDLRLLRGENKAFCMQSLNLPRGVEAEISRALHGRGKMLVVTGPTGSGKTTTLYSFLAHLKDGSRKIVTVENPIEYRISGIQQVQINEAIDVTFASSLRSILRQDPDVIMVGEIRDAETAEISLQAAQTGHLVLSTLHTNDALSAITRLLNLGSDLYTIGSSIAGILAQRLVRKLCTACRGPLEDVTNEDALAALVHFGSDTKAYVAGKGCEACGFSGYKGRSAVVSYLDINDEIAALILRGAPLAQIEEVALCDSAFRTLEGAALQLVTDGVTSVDEIQDYIRHRPHSNARQKQKTASSPSTDKEAQKSTTDAAKPKLRRPKVLIVDDNEEILEIFTIMLQREQFEPIVAHDGQEALEKVFSEEPHVVLCDLQMPKMDGKSFLQAMRSNPATKPIPIIILTARDDEESEIELMNNGARDFVSKSSSSKIVLSRIRRVLGD